MNSGAIYYETLAPALNRAIKHATANGWMPAGMKAVKADESGKIIFVSKDGNEFEPMSIYDVVYDREFAKALWGETKKLESGEYPPEVIVYKDKPMWEPWSYHLQRMVIADNPLQYLEENI